MCTRRLAILAIICHLIAMDTCQAASLCPVPCHCSTHYYVYCQNTGLQDWQLSDVLSKVSPSAVVLDLSANHLTGIPPDAFASLPNLEYLSLAANEITEIPTNAFAGLSNLQELTLHRNRITAIKPGAFNDLISLKELHLGDNVIEFLPNQVFSNLTELQKLQLQKNSITTLIPGAFAGLPKIQILNISHNSLQSLVGFTFSGLKTLKKLSLNDNSLNKFELDSFSGLTSLEYLELERNNITEMVFLYGNDFYLSLKILSLSQNRIVSVPSHVLPHNQNLRHVDLSHNIIRRIGGHSFNNMKLDFLTLHGNNISLINRDMFKGVKRISDLYISDNRVENILTGAFDSFRETLLVFDLHSNKLKVLHRGMFRGMRKLRIFNLADNVISTVEPDSFQATVSLNELNLSGNNFTSISSGIISGPQGLRRLSVMCNPLHRLTGFALNRADDNIMIVSNSTMIDSSPTTAVITWPYVGSTHLYWSLSVNCVNPLTCKVPEYESILKPYLTQVTVTGLTSGAEYFICVDPVFLSPDAHISQCVQVRTEYVSSYRQSTGPVSGKETSNLSSSPSLSPLLILLLLIMSVVLKQS